MLIIIAYLIHQASTPPNFNSMNAPFMEEFHQKRKKWGIVYTSSDWLKVALDMEISIQARESIFSSVSECDVLSGPIILQQMNQSAFIIKAILKQVELCITVSLGMENGPVICWACHPLEARMLESISIKQAVQKGGRYE